jgi:penicillin-binding protein-related factor A (putative recombinase)
MLKQTEKQIQNAILEYLNYLPECKAWTNQSVGIYNPATGGFRRQVGKYTSKGVSDIIGIYHGKMLCIEVKSKTGKLSEHQEMFLKEMKRHGAIAFVARSVNDVAEVLKLYKDSNGTFPF